MSKKVKLYNKKWYGVEVSQYGLKNGYVDYETLSKIVSNCGGLILNNFIYSELINKDCYFELVNGNEYDEENDQDLEVYQYYIISESGADFLEKWTDELVFYNDDLDIYLWGVTHFGTGWDYVLTNIEIDSEEE